MTLNGVEESSSDTELKLKAAWGTPLQLTIYVALWPTDLVSVFPTKITAEAKSGMQERIEMNFLSKLRSKFRLSKLRRELRPKPEDDRLAIILLGMLTPQISVLELELGTVPVDEKFASRECRGYLFGLAAGIGIQEGLLHKKFDTLVAAFCLVYGNQHGTRLAIQTTRECEAGQLEVILASEWAIKEVARIYAEPGKPWTAMGFYFAATGQPIF